MSSRGGTANGGKFSCHGNAMPKQGAAIVTPLEPKYSRSPSPELQELLQIGGFLSPLVQLSGKKEAKSGLSLDVHFRPQNHLDVYCGHARIIGIRIINDQTINVFADDIYTKSNKELFKTWSIDEHDFEKVLNTYMDQLKLPEGDTIKESKLQADWSQVTTPWVPFDREVVLSYGHIDRLERITRFPEVDNARLILKSIAARPGSRRRSWAEPKDKLGNRLDQIAVDDRGNLVLIEVKDASANPAQVFYAPLQLLQYIHEWRRAFGWLSVSQSLQELIYTRVNLGLMPEVVPLTGGIRAAVCFGEDTRSEEVKRRYYEALGVVNAHLPAHVLPVETWSYASKGVPKSL